MKTRLTLFAVIVALSCVPSKAADKKFKFAGREGFVPEQTTVPWASYTRQGYGLQMWISNQMIMGREAVDGGSIPFDPNCGVGVGAKYPPGACVEHLFGAGPWIAALIRDTVHGTSVRACRQGYDDRSMVSYILPNVGDTIWHAISNDPFAPFGAVSDNDLSFSATDTFKSPVVNKPVLGIKVFVKSYAFITSQDDENAILPFEYYVINIGHNRLDSVYLGMFADMSIGWTDEQFFPVNFASYNDSLQMAYVQNNRDQTATPFGLTLLTTPIPIQKVGRHIFRWWSDGTGPAEDDSTLYAWMSGDAYPNALIDTNQVDSIWGSRVLISAGPFGPLIPGDTLHFSAAFISGNCVDGCSGSLTENAVTAKRLSGSNWVTGVRAVKTDLPRSFALFQNYPNPFNPSTRIQYALLEAARVTVTIYNLLGQRVRTLVSEYQQAGYKSVSFDGSDLASGVYVCRLQAGNYSDVKKMVLIR